MFGNYYSSWFPDQSAGIVVYRYIKLGWCCLKDACVSCGLCLSTIGWIALFRSSNAVLRSFSTMMITIKKPAYVERTVRFGNQSFMYYYWLPTSNFSLESLFMDEVICNISPSHGNTRIKLRTTILHTQCSDASLQQNRLYHAHRRHGLAGCASSHASMMQSLLCLVSGQFFPLGYNGLWRITSGRRLAMAPMQLIDCGASSFCPRPTESSTGGTQRSNTTSELCDPFMANVCTDVVIHQPGLVLPNK